VTWISGSEAASDGVRVGNGIVTNGITVNTAPLVDASFCSALHHLVSHATIVMFAPNSQELRELIQGPGDVEWRYDLAPVLSNPVRGLLSSAGMTCGISVRRFYLASYSALFKSQRI